MAEVGASASARRKPAGGGHGRRLRDEVGERSVVVAGRRPMDGEDPVEIGHDATGVSRGPCRRAPWSQPGSARRRASGPIAPKSAFIASLERVGGQGVVVGVRSRRSTPRSRRRCRGGRVYTSRAGLVGHRREHRLEGGEQLGALAGLSGELHEHAGLGHGRHPTAPRRRRDAQSRSLCRLRMHGQRRGEHEATAPTGRGRSRRAPNSGPRLVTRPADRQNTAPVEQHRRRQLHRRGAGAAPLPGRRVVEQRGVVGVVVVVGHEHGSARGPASPCSTGQGGRRPQLRVVGGADDRRHRARPRPR